MEFSELSVLLGDWKFSINGGSCLAHCDNFSWLPDNSIDLILTDPPFNIARDTNFHTYEKNTINSYRFDGQKGWDTYTPAEFRSLLGEWTREFKLRHNDEFKELEVLVNHLRSNLSAAESHPLSLKKAHT